ncbi:unnamed protein product [Cochlearia groenlandica]
MYVCITCLRAGSTVLLVITRRPRSFLLFGSTSLLLPAHLWLKSMELSEKGFKKWSLLLHLTRLLISLFPDFEFSFLKLHRDFDHYKEEPNSNNNNNNQKIHPQPMEESINQNPEAMEALISNLFGNISSLKSAYIELQSVDPAARIFQKGSEFSDSYMESVVKNIVVDEKVEKPRVGLMVTHGFWIGGRVIQSRVYVSSVKVVE